MLAPDANGPQESAWKWEPPSYTRFVRWFFSSAWALLRRHPVAVPAALLAALTVLYAYRSLYQPYALLIGIYLDAIVATILFYLVLWFALKRIFRHEWMRVVGTFVGIGAFMLIMWYGASLHRYAGQYFLYRTLEYVELTNLPVTEPQHERVLPLNGVHTLAKWRRDQTETVSKPNLVKYRDGSCWSMAVEPDRFMQQWRDPIDEILCVPSTEATPDLARSGLTKVHFEIGENLRYSRNTENCVRRALGPIRFFAYEPARAVYIERGKGEWVQVVPWVKWVGTWGPLFPRPVFGGVQVIEQEGPYLWYERWTWQPFKRTFFGCGTWIPAQEVHKHQYLRGQNLVPDIVSRSMAESFRFQEGFTAPWQIFKSGDVRIADLPDDVNEQPFTSFYRMPPESKGDAKLYDSFALEPEDATKRVLYTSFFVPGDGIGPSFVYRHSQKNEAPGGVTAVPHQVRVSRTDVFWSDRKPVEHRFYIRDIADSNGVVRRRLMYLTTVVLVDDKQKSKGAPDFIVGSIPSLAITDSDTLDVVWVDPHTPEKWEDAVREKFGPLWARRAR